MTRTIVVGAGIIGLSIAYNLAKEGADVLVLEKKYPGCGLSVRAIGGVHTQWDNEHDIKLAIRNHQLLSQLPSELDFNIPFRRDGYLMLATDEQENVQLEKNVNLQQSLGNQTNLLSKEEITHHYPYIDTTSIAGGALSKRDGVVYPFSLVYGYWRALTKHGGRLLRPVTVRRLEANGSRITAASTDDATYEADVFIIAAGPSSREILQSVSTVPPTHLVKHEMFATEPLKFFLKPTIQLCPNTLYFNQSLRGEIICDMQSPDQHDPQPTLAFLEKSADELTKLLPTLRDLKVLRSWTGTLEVTSDLDPIVGKQEYDNLWVAFADSGKGIMFAPSIGELVTQSILTGEIEPEISPYTPERTLT